MRTRNISIPLRVTEKELEQINKKAKKARLSRTEYLTTVGYGKEITLIEDLKPILANLRRVGNNLNQLTKQVNMGRIKAVYLTECLEILNKTYLAIHEFARNNESIIQVWLGHSNISTTADIYSHLDSGAKNQASKVI